LRPHEVIELSDSDVEEIDVIEIFDSDEEESIVNPNDLLQTRRTVRDWFSDKDWVISREEFHSEQVNRDRELPASLKDLTSSYVSPICFCFFFSIFSNHYCLKAISADDLESMHRYLMVRYEAETFDNYMHLLTMFRNTRAIEAAKARDRVFELNDISNAIEIARQSVLRRLQLRRASS